MKTPTPSEITALAACLAAGTVLEGESLDRFDLLG